MKWLTIEFSVLLLFFAAFLVTPLNTPGQFGTTGNPVSLTGTVFSSPGNQRIEHATVRLCDSGGNLIEQSLTTDSGEFGFRGIEHGTYILKVDAAGYQAAEINVDLNFASDRGLRVELKPLETGQPAADAPRSTVSAHETSMPQRSRDLVSAGRKKLYLERNPQASLSDFEHALAKAPGYYEAYYEIGMAHVQLAQLQDAEKSFRKAVEISSDRYGDADVALGTMLVEKGSAAEGEKCIRRGLALNSASWMGHFELGKLEFDQNRLDDARKSAEQARSLAPSAPVVYRLLANIHLKQKDYPAVLQDIDAYVKLDPNSPAGVRAKQMREEISRKIAAQSDAPAPAPSKPQ